MFMRRRARLWPSTESIQPRQFHRMNRNARLPWSPARLHYGGWVLRRRCSWCPGQSKKTLVYLYATKRGKGPNKGIEWDRCSCGLLVVYIPFSTWKSCLFVQRGHEQCSTTVFVVVCKTSLLADTESIQLWIAGEFAFMGIASQWWFVVMFNDTHGRTFTIIAVGVFYVSGVFLIYLMVSNTLFSQVLE